MRCLAPRQACTPTAHGHVAAAGRADPAVLVKVHPTALQRMRGGAKLSRHSRKRLQRLWCAARGLQVEAVLAAPLRLGSCGCDCTCPPPEACLSPGTASPGRAVQRTAAHAGSGGARRLRSPSPRCCACRQAVQQTLACLPACRLDKQRENEAALIVLPDLLAELDRLDPHARLLALVQGALAGNIFDWGAKATVELYHDGTILEIYRCSQAGHVDEACDRRMCCRLVQASVARYACTGWSEAMGVLDRDQPIQVRQAEHAGGGCWRMARRFVRASVARYVLTGLSRARRAPDHGQPIQVWQAAYP